MKRESHVSFFAKLFEGAVMAAEGMVSLFAAPAMACQGPQSRLIEIPFLSQVLSGRHCHVPCAVGVGHCTTTWRIPMGMQKRALIQDAEFD